MNFSPVTINQYYDPMVEFLELGVSYENRTEWKLYGPDLNGRYGGLNGTGGLDGVSPYLNLFNPVISDFRGNILAEITNGVVSWISARPTGYGAVPNYRPVALGHGADVAQSSAWRGRWVDITGYYNIGMRLYDPIAGMWLSYDSAWNERDPNYLTFAGGEPIMGFDPDGRIGASFYDKVVGGIENSLSILGESENVRSSSTMAGWSSLLGDNQSAQNFQASANEGLSYFNNQEQLAQAQFQQNYNYYGNSSFLAYNAIFNPAVNAELAGGEMYTGSGMRPDNSGQTLNYQQWVNSSSDFLLGGAQTVAFAYGAEQGGMGIYNLATAMPGATAQFTEADVQSAIARLETRGVQTTEVQSSIDPNQVIAIARAMQSGAFQNALMDSPVIMDPTVQAIIAGNHRVIAAEMTGFNLDVNSIPGSATTPMPLSGVPLQAGRVNPPILNAR